MAFMKRVNFQVGREADSVQKIFFNGGVNNGSSELMEIQDNQCPQIDNAIVLENPTLQCMNGFGEDFWQEASPYPFAYPNMIHHRDFKPIVHDNTKCYWWNSSTSAWDEITGATVANARSKMVTWSSGGTQVQIFHDGTTGRYFQGVLGTFTAIANMPASNLFCVDDNRVWSLLAGQIYISDRDSYTNWTTGEATNFPLNSWSGTATALTKWQDIVLACSTDKIHFITGNDPEDFDQESISPISPGVISDRSIIEYNNTIYYMGFDKKIYRLEGLTPKEISRPVDYWLNSMDSGNGQYVVCAGRYKHWLIWNIPVGQIYNTIMLVYDTILDIWQKWDHGTVQFMNMKEVLYSLGNSNASVFTLFDSEYVYSVDHNESAINWNVYTKYFNMGTKGFKKRLYEVVCHIYKPSGSQMALGYEDMKSGSFTTLQSFSGSTNDQVVKVNVPSNVVNDSNFFRLKFTCQGQGKIYSIEMKYRVKRR